MNDLCFLISISVTTSTQKQKVMVQQCTSRPLDSVLFYKPKSFNLFFLKEVKRNYGLWGCFHGEFPTHKCFIPLNVLKNGITDVCSTADCCSLLTICPSSCPRHASDDVIITAECRYHRLPPDGAVIETFEFCSLCSAVAF